MAKVSDLYCDVTNEIASLLTEGREPEAKAKAAQYLRDGSGSSHLFQKLIANTWVDPPPRRGRPPGVRDWYKIGEAFEELRSTGLTHEKAKIRVAAQFHRGEDAIEKIVKRYRTAVRAAREE
jgi:hypothetical protein